MQSLSLRDLGGGCDAGNNPQGGKAKCNGNPPMTLVNVTYTGKDPDKITVDPASNIDIDETFSLTATGRDDETDG